MSYFGSSNKLEELKDSYFLYLFRGTSTLPYQCINNVNPLNRRLHKMYANHINREKYEIYQNKILSTET